MENTDTQSKFFLPGSVIIAGLLIAGAVLWNGSHPGGTVAGAPNAPKVDITDIQLAGDPYIGKADAPVTIAFWSDFQCPYCKAAEVGGVAQITTPPSIPDIIKNYVDTGKAKIVFLDFAFLGDDSVVAGEYGRAIWKLYPEKYFEWRTAMYKAQDAEGDQGFGDTPSIDKLTATIAGIDAKKVAADVVQNATAYNALMDADKAEAQKIGANATPSFVIGKQLIAGAYPYATFQAALDVLLK